MRGSQDPCRRGEGRRIPAYNERVAGSLPTIRGSQDLCRQGEGRRIPADRDRAAGSLPTGRGSQDPCWLREGHRIPATIIYISHGYLRLFVSKLKWVVVCCWNTIDLCTPTLSYSRSCSWTTVNFFVFLFKPQPSSDHFIGTLGICWPLALQWNVVCSDCRGLMNGPLSAYAGCARRIVTARHCAGVQCQRAIVQACSVSGPLCRRAASLSAPSKVLRAMCSICLPRAIPVQYMPTVCNTCAVYAYLVQYLCSICLPCTAFLVACN